MTGPEAGVLQAAASFGIDGARVLEMLAASTQNENWLIEDGTGRLVLRRCVRNASVERQYWQRELERHLEQADFPIPTVKAAPRGELVIEVDSEPWTLSAFVPGEHYDFTRPSQAEEAGRRLAEFHLKSRALADDDQAATALSYAPRRHYLLGAEAELAALRRRLAGAGFDRDLDALEGWVRDELGAWPLGRFDALPRGLIHGDYHGRNLIFEGDTLAALLDFDMVEPGPFVLDLARAIPAFARAARGSYEIRVDFGRRFLDAYASVRPLSGEERSAIPLFAALWQCPLDVFYDLHPQARLDPLKTARSDFANWHATRGQQHALEEVVARSYTR